MGEAELVVPVVIVIGPGAADEVVGHTRSVLKHYEIAFQEMNWHDFSGFLSAGGECGLRVVVFATGIAYTDEHLQLPEDVIVPVLRVITDPAPPADQIVTNTAMMATVGWGVPGAVNTGLQAARILATSDAALRDLLIAKPYPVQ